MNCSVIFVLIIALSLTQADRFHVHECVHSKNCHVHDFEISDLDPSPSQNLTLSFAVKLKNVDRLYQLVDQVSDPKSQLFGKHWSYAQVAELCHNPEGVKKVTHHLLKFVDASQIKTTKYGGFVRVTTDLPTAEQILKTKYHKFKSRRSGEEVLRTLEFTLPPEVSVSVDYVYPTIQFSSNIKESKSVLVGEMDAQQARVPSSVTPLVLNQYYNITSNIVSNSNVTQSIFATLGQSFSPKDLSAFQKHFGMKKDPVDTIIGKNAPKSCSSSPDDCAEASLDLQYIMSIAQRAPTTFWSTTGSFSTWSEDVAAAPNPPLVHSISYGSYEQQTWDTEQQRFSQEVAKLGAQGVTVVVASGDDGVANYGARQSAAYCGFFPSYPANVPYVLSVGATMGTETGTPEIACQGDKGAGITTGGGFSTVFPQPSYQNSLVSTYLSTYLNSSIPTSMFNSAGRGYPDVSIAGNNYQVAIDQRLYLVSGTSASSPVWAGIITLANSLRLNRGKSSLGFVNPILYQLFVDDPTIFHDVVQGNNRCTASSICCSYGFNASPGWDPVTGLGSVNVGRLLDALKKI